MHNRTYLFIFVFLSFMTLILHVYTKQVCMGDEAFKDKHKVKDYYFSWDLYGSVKNTQKGKGHNLQ